MTAAESLFAFNFAEVVEEAEAEEGAVGMIGCLCLDLVAHGGLILYAHVARSTREIDFHGVIHFRGGRFQVVFSVQAPSGYDETHAVLLPGRGTSQQQLTADCSGSIGPIKVLFCIPAEFDLDVNVINLFKALFSH